MKQLSQGLSVVVPTKGGVERLPMLLSSLERQSLNPNLWEAIFIVNGGDDGAGELLDGWRRRTGVNARVLFLDVPSAGAARNLGLAAVSREYTTFVDDDDWLEESFLEHGLRFAEAQGVVLMPLKETDSINGTPNSANSINFRRQSQINRRAVLSQSPWTLGFNACKIVSSALLKQYRYDPQLRSGEDVAFFAHLLRHPELELIIPERLKGDSYVRIVRANSVSRRAKDYDFCVRQRLQVISSLQKLDLSGPARKAAKSLELSQFRFVTEYLQHHPEDFADAVDVALSLGVRGMPWRRSHSSQAKRLVISYCFPPFADPAANVVAKRIVSDAKFVDVVSADMTPVRETDLSSEALVEPWIQQHWKIGGFPAFNSWAHISAFAKKAVRAADSRYEALYSRALWSGSHVAAALYKLRNPSVFWEAEFSDPLRFAVDGQPRVAEEANGLLARKLRAEIKRKGWAGEEVSGHFALTELATLVLADRVSFSNHNQAGIVLSSYSYAFQEMVRRKLVVEPQPVPPGSAYESSQSELSLPKDVITIGFFGNFYKNRGLGNYLAALEALPREVASEFQLHIFSHSKPDESIEPLCRSGNIVLHDPLDYLQFLNAASQFDVLLVTDTRTKDTRFELNPFLPSKLADYEGAGVDIWAMVEPGSPLASRPTAFKSDLDDVEGAAGQMLAISRRKSRVSEGSEH